MLRNLADAMGVPVGALKKMASEGLLTSAVLAENLPKALGQLREEAKSVQNISGAFTVLKNNIMEMVGAQSNASWTTKALASGISGLANNLDLVAAAARRAGGRLQQRVAALVAAARAAAHSGVEPAGAPAGDSIGVLAYVFGRADARAGILAEYADAARIAGAGCERDYDALTFPQQGPIEK